MSPAALVDERFELRDVVASGGMGTVYRALDRATASIVAVKVLKDSNAEALARFAHEARILEEVEHPHIVRYVAHGIAGTGESYLAMEWLDGQTLMHRLDDGPLRIDEALNLARQLASGLGAVHLRGIVHRDVKPGNIFLQSGDVGRAKLLDFGIARVANGQTALTLTGTLIGTPGYMAPEQAKGPQDSFDSRIDVFSLGCVLFECLTGRQAFPGTHLLARLAKLLMEDPPRARELRPDVPEALDELISRMLKKDPNQRPESGQHVISLLDRIDTKAHATVPSMPISAESLTHTEKLLVSVVAVAPSRVEMMEQSGVTTRGASIPANMVRELRRMAQSFGAKIEEITNGMIIALLVGSGPATDQTATAARCALRMRALLPHSSFVLLTGRGESTSRLPVGQVLENAASLLERVSPLNGDGCIWIDETTRALLDVRFECSETDGRIVLLDERDIGSEARTLLGKPSPFVGRDRELRHLLETIEDAIAEPNARALLITGEAGAGKSRLRYELIQRLKSAHPDMVIALARGDSIGAGAPFGMIASTFRNSAGIARDERLADVQAKLIFGVGKYFQGDDAWRVSRFIGEMLGLPFDDDHDPRIRAAKQNPAIMADQIQAAYVDLVRAFVSRVPLLLVLEDLHWGDGVSVKLIDAALRELAGMPYIVIAFARPEVHQIFPQLWIGRGVQTIPLRGLPRRAAENLVTNMLGDSPSPETIAAIVDQAGGNAFYLEELIRTVAGGHTEKLPETVLGMVGARIAALSPEVRRTLRAASVFGKSFWESGVKRLLRAEFGSDGTTYLKELCDRELIGRRIPSRFSEEVEYAFRHALVQEGAYAMLTDRDRKLGHDLAAEWFLQIGELEPMVLAAHFERGTTPAKAAEYYAKAAERALRGADFPAAIARAEKGLAVGADGETKAMLYGLLAGVHILVAQYARSYECASLLLADPSISISSRVRALGHAVVSAVFLGKYDAFGELFPEILSVDPDAEMAVHVIQALYSVFVMLLVSGQKANTAPFLKRIDEIGSKYHDDLVVNAWVEFAHTFASRELDNDLWSARQHNQTSVAQYASAGARQYVAITRAHLGLSHLQLGLLEEAESLFDHVLATPDSGDLAIMYAKYYKSRLCLESSRLDEALSMAESLAQHALAATDYVMLWCARLLIVGVLIASDKLNEADAILDELGEGNAFLPFLRTRFLSLRAEIRRIQGRTEEAVRLAAESVALSNAGPHYNYGKDPLHLRYALALHAAGDLEGARAAIRETRNDIYACAAKIPDESVRRSYLHNVTPHARTLALAQEWLGE